MSLKNRQIVLIMTDTQRHDMLGCYRETGLRTPCLDELAAGGIRFDKAYTVQPVCQPARAAIFTGLHPHACNSWTNSSGLAGNVRHIGQRLRRHGIETAYIGKWHLDGGDYFGLGRCPDGWDPDYWFDMRNYLEQMDPQDRLLSRNPANMKTHDFPDTFTYAHQCSDRAIRYLENHADDPFLLVVSYDEPHDPSICPKEYYEAYQDYTFPKSENIHDTLADKPAYQRVWAGASLNSDKDQLQIRNPAFFGCNSFVDHEAGRVIAAIRRLAPEALIIYTADHGDFLHGHSLSGKGPAAYEEITHIPLIMNGPGIEPGRIDNAPVSHLNLAPTLFDLYDLPQPQVFAGKSLLPQLDGHVDQVNPYVFIEFGRYEVDHDGFGGFQPMRAVYDGRYKLAIHLLSGDELYDLAEDPEEMVNLIGSPGHADVRNRLHDAILAEMNASRDPFRGYYWASRPWRMDIAEAAPPTWDGAGMTRQREDEDFEPRQLDYATGLEMTSAVRKKQASPARPANWLET